MNSVTSIKPSVNDRQLAPPRASAAINSLVGRLTDSWKSLAAAWNDFWFAPADPTSLGLIRLLVGGMLVYTHIIWGTQLSAFFGSTGWQRAATLGVIQDDMIVPSFWWLVSDAWLLPVHCLSLVILVLFWIGFATRVTSVLSLIITISYIYRVQMAGFGLDQLNTILCLYLCIGPSGATLSVDRWLAVRKARRARKDQSNPVATDLMDGLPVARSSSANLALRLMQIHFCVIYAWAGLSKVQGPAWWNGEAVWLAFANLEYQTVDMTWVAWYPWLAELMTHTSLAWELSFAALIWVRPLRPLMLAIGFLLHVGIGGAMGMWTFGLIMIFGHVCFWPNAWVRRVVHHLPGATVLGLMDATVPDDRPVTVPLERSKQRPVQASTENQPKAPSLLCVGGGRKRRIACLGYFMERGFRCSVAENSAEARAVRDASDPDAVVVLGTTLSDDELCELHEQHAAGTSDRHLFLILSSDQSARLNGHIAAPNSHVFTDAVRLGVLRRQIEHTLDRSQQSSTPAVSETDS